MMARELPGHACHDRATLDALLAGKQDVLPFLLRFCRVDADGTLLSGLGVTGVTRAATGRYDIGFEDVGRVDYSVFVTTHGISSDPNTVITNEAPGSCRVNIASGDNGDAADTPLDRPFSFILLAVRS